MKISWGISYLPFQKTGEKSELQLVFDITEQAVSLYRQAFEQIRSDFISHKTTMLKVIEETNLKRFFKNVTDYNNFF